MGFTVNPGPEREANRKNGVPSMGFPVTHVGFIVRQSLQLPPYLSDLT